MFCSAMVKPKVAAEIPRSSVIGRMKRPRLCRSPMHSEMISPLKRIKSSIARRLPGVAMRFLAGRQVGVRSEERRVGKDGGTPTATAHCIKKRKRNDNDMRIATPQNTKYPV